MKVTINKKEEQLREGTTIEEILKERKNHRPAVWVNGNQLLKVEYPTYVVNEGDVIKILKIMAGG